VSPIDNQTRERISAFVICCDEQKNIRRCLESIKWCDEIVVVDSGSKDQTVEICKEYTSKVIFRAWEGFVQQKRFALSQCQMEWVLNIDADEEVSPELREEIQQKLSHPVSDVNGYYLSRVVFYFGKWWKKGGWYPEYRLRLCRRSVTSWGGHNPHEKASVTGRVKRLKSALHHYTFADLRDQMTSINKLSSAAADNLYKRGRKTSLVDLSLRPLSRFVKFYFLKKGFLEGLPGLIVGCLESFSVFLKYAKLWELHHFSKKVKEQNSQPDQWLRPQ
jgi:glycosyltransferase involved in cell wall biosynthesis